MIEIVQIDVAERVMGRLGPTRAPVQLKLLFHGARGVIADGRHHCRIAARPRYVIAPNVDLVDESQANDASQSTCARFIQTAFSHSSLNSGYLLLLLLIVI